MPRAFVLINVESGSEDEVLKELKINKRRVRFRRRSSEGIEDNRGSGGSLLFIRSVRSNHEN